MTSSVGLGEERGKALSALPGISPTTGEKCRGTRIASVLNVFGWIERPATGPLPPCGGDGRQAREGLSSPNHHRLTGTTKTTAHSNITPLTRTRAKRLCRERTTAEQIMWNILRDFQPRGARFRRETPIAPYIADFAWLTARIVIEVDGDSHETEQGRIYDRHRDTFLTNQGFTVLRFDNAETIDNPDYVSRNIESHFEHLLSEATP